MTCPPCHGACNQGRDCPNRRPSLLPLAALLMFIGMVSAAVTLVVAG